MAKKVVKQPTMRNAVFTLNNWTPEERNALWTFKPIKYMVIGEEVGEEGTPHLQGYAEFTYNVKFSTLKNLCSRVHWEKRKGSALQAAHYCMKDGKYEEKGELSQQGKRTDIDKVRNEILEGKKVDMIVLENPEFYHQYGRTLSKIEDLAMRQKFRTEMTKGVWYWGSTGVGKSHIAFQNFHPSTHYVLPNDKGWWDAYTQQDTVIINDFRGEIKYNELLQLVDKWPYSVKRRGREPMPFTSKLVIITSSLPPCDIYKNRLEEDSLEQLLRRFEVKEVLEENVTF